MKLRKRKDGYWTTQVKTPDGRYRSVYARTKRECEAKARGLLVSVDTGEYVPKDNMTLSDWHREWLESYTANIKDTTKRIYESTWRSRIAPALGAMRVQDITRGDVQRWVSSLTRHGYRSGTVKSSEAVLCRMLRDAVRAGLIGSNPCSDIVQPRGDAREMKVVGSDRVGDFLKAAAQTKYADVFEFMLLTGLRVGELRGLTIDRYDPREGTVLIDRQLRQSANVFDTPKNKKARTIVLCSRAREIVEERIRRVEEERVERPWFDPLNVVFCGKSGAPLWNGTLAKELKKAAKVFGEPGLRLHDLRHSFATISLELGIDVKTIQECMGHSSAAMTLDRYSHSTDTMKRRAAETLDGAFGI